MVHWLRESNVRNWSSYATHCVLISVDNCRWMENMHSNLWPNIPTKWSFIMPSATVVYYHKTLLCSLYETETEQSKYVIRLFSRNYVLAKAEKHQYFWLRVYSMWEPQPNEIDKFIPPAPIFLHCPLETRQQLPAFQAQKHMCFFLHFRYDILFYMSYIILRDLYVPHSACNCVLP